MHHHMPVRSWKWNSCHALPHCLGAVGSAIPAIQLLQCTTTLPRGSGQRYSCNALPHRLGTVGGATPAIHCLTAWGQWAVELLQILGPPTGGTGSPTQEAVAAERADVLPCTATLPGCST